MSMGKFFTSTLITVLFSLSAFAGGTGGGGVAFSHVPKNEAVADFEPTNALVFHMGNSDGLVRFAYATLADGQWDVQYHSADEAELMANASISNAIEESLVSNGWASVE